MAENINSIIVKAVLFLYCWMHSAPNTLKSPRTAEPDQSTKNGKAASTQKMSFIPFADWTTHWAFAGLTVITLTTHFSQAFQKDATPTNSSKLLKPKTPKRLNLTGSNTTSIKLCKSNAKWSARCASTGRTLTCLRRAKPTSRQ
jgi:hypothetical protein